MRIKHLSIQQHLQDVLKRTITILTFIVARYWPKIKPKPMRFTWSWLWDELIYLDIKNMCFKLFIQVSLYICIKINFKRSACVCPHKKYYTVGIRIKVNYLQKISVNYSISCTIMNISFQSSLRYTGCSI